MAELLLFVELAADRRRLTKRVRFAGRYPEASLLVRATAAVDLDLPDMVHLARAQLRDALLSLSAKAGVPPPPDLPDQV